MAPSLVVAGVAAAACFGRAPAPAIAAVDPVFAPGNAATPLRVLGENFLAKVAVDFDSPASSPVDTGFALSLVSGDVRVALQSVRLLSEHEFSAVLPALAAAPGTYDLEIQDPRGVRATLPSALQVLLWDCAAPAPLPDGTPCGSAACVAGGTCQAGVCVCTNTAPLPCFTVTPGAGVAGATSFAFDASCSSDHEDLPSGLQIRFGYGDGTPVASFSTAKTTTHTYPAAVPGSPPRVVTTYVEVTDTGGLVTFARRRLVVFNAGDELPVTTAADGGAGSLRDVISRVNLLHMPKVITFAGAYRIVLLSALPPLDADEAAIVGRPGVELDCSAVGLPCLSLNGSDQFLAGLAVSGSPGVSVEIGGTDSRVAECRIESAPSSSSVGILVTGSAVVGPGNDTSGADVGIRVASATATVDGNRVHDNRIGLTAIDSTATIQRNVVYANASSGIQVTGTTGTVRFNTVDGNGADGLSPSGSVRMDVRDNLFTNNAAYGVSVPLDGPSRLDHDGYSGNGHGAIGGGAPGPVDVTANPRYLDRPGGDFRLLPGSPAVNAGVDVRLDVNGPAPGNYNGDAPDLGALETPY